MPKRGLIAALLLVAACSPDITSTAPSGSVAGLPSASIPIGASESPGASASEVPSVAPSAGPPTPSLGPAGIPVLLPGSAIEVTVAELNLRAGPSTSAARTEILKRGQVLIVSPYDGVFLGAGPVRKAYTWYHVMKLQTGDEDGDLPALPMRPILIGTEVEVGWIATDNKEVSYVKVLPPRCPAVVDLANVQGMLAAERLACFGGGPIVLEGTFGCPNCGAELQGDFDPIWLNYPQSLDFLSVNASQDIGPVVLRFPPDGPGRPAGGSIIRVTVHVDDPAADGCSITIQGEAPVPPATAELYCREQLVVDSYEVIGMDAGFGG
jgi:hypothetical protein